MAANADMSARRVHDAATGRVAAASFAVAPEMLAHTFIVERFLRAVVPDVPADARLCSYVQPGMEAYHPALEGAELEAYRELMASPHRDFAGFRASWGAVGFARTALPRKMQYGKGGKEKGQRERYLRALFQWNRFFAARKLELRYLGPHAGFGVFFRDGAGHIMEVTDLAPLRGTVVEVSGAAMEHWFLRARRFGLVDRALRYRDAGARWHTRTLRGVLVGPMALVNGACAGCFNAYSYVVGRRAATEWRECQLARAVAPGSQLLYYYGPDHYIEACMACNKELKEFIPAGPAEPEDHAEGAFTDTALAHVDSEVEFGLLRRAAERSRRRNTAAVLGPRRNRDASKERAHRQPPTPYATRAAAAVAGKQ